MLALTAIAPKLAEKGDKRGAFVTDMSLTTDTNYTAYTTVNDDD